MIGFSFTWICYNDILFNGSELKIGVAICCKVLVGSCYCTLVLAFLFCFGNCIQFYICPVSFLSCFFKTICCLMSSIGLNTKIKIVVFSYKSCYASCFYLFLRLP
jgi:hypothetical protein